MRIYLTSVFVDDQDQALAAYTELLGFIKKQEIPVGEFKWLTVVSPDDPDGPQLLLEPSDNPAARAFKEALHAQGIPMASFAVDDIQVEYERLKQQGIRFTMTPTNAGSSMVAVFDDTCGNLIQIVQT
jgi:catechol 2,3-dioxygenase-like lactoylglutathione lyase family enzyme